MKHKMLLTSVIVLLILYASLCFAQRESSQLFNSLNQNPKLIQPELVLEDFVQGKTMTRVIVNLSEPASLQQNANFRDMGYRQVLQKAVRAAQDRVISIVDASQVHVTNRFVYIFGFSAEVTPEGLETLSKVDDVVSINKDHILKAHLAQGIPLINATNVRNNYNGTGISIAICDTGIDYTHPRLGGGSFPNTKVIGGYDCGDEDNDPIDTNGHGTCCAGIAAGGLGTVGNYIGGVAHNARLYALKVVSGGQGTANTSDIIQAWEWCVTHQNDDTNNPIMIISTSFGGGYHTSSCDSDTPLLTKAASNAVAAGITLFVSSGNDGLCDGTGLPACITHVNAVGAVYDADIGAHNGICTDLDSCIGYSEPLCSPRDDPWACDDTTTDDDLVTCYSNSANFIKLFAPANNAHTTDIVGSGGYNTTGDYFTTFGGTSAACPYAAGAAACLQNAAQSITGSFLTPGQVECLLTSMGDRVEDTKQGQISITKPRVNLGKAVTAMQLAVYVDGTWTGIENGTFANPYNTVSEGVNAVSPGGFLYIKAGNYTGTQNVPIATNKTMTILSCEGTATIGE